MDDATGEAVEVSQPTDSRIRKQYVEEGLEAALITLACGKPPAG